MKSAYILNKTAHLAACEANINQNYDNGNTMFQFLPTVQQ